MPQGKQLQAIPRRKILFNLFQYGPASPINQVQRDAVEGLAAQDFFDLLPDRA